MAAQTEDFQHCAVDLETIYIFYRRSQKCRMKRCGGDVRIPCPIGVSRVNSERAEKSAKVTKICLADVMIGSVEFLKTKGPWKT